MKLSTFDLSWYQQWSVQKTAAEEWSRPGLTNFLGSVQTGGDVTSLRHLIFPPVSGAEESTGYLTINGTFLAATQLQTHITWCPWEIRRQVVHESWTITSRTCLPPGAHAALQLVEIENGRDQAADLAVALRLSGRCVNRGLEPWYWSVPSVALSVTDLLDHAGLDPIRARVDDDTVLWQERPPSRPHPFVGQAFNAQTFAPAPHEWKRNGDPAFVFHVAAGASVTIAWAVALESSSVAAVSTARAVTQDAARHFADARAQWQQLWLSAFSAEGPLSGQLPDLDVPTALAPVAASGLLCALQARRTHRANHGQPLYNISTPRRVEACFYPNDWGMASRTLAKVDPAVTWRQL